MTFSRIFRTGALASLFTATGGLSLLADIELPPGAADCVRWAAGDVRSALVSRGVPVSEAGIRVVGMDSAEPRDDQAFSIRIKGAQVELQGGGPAGQMYALQELAEQIENAPRSSTWSGLVSALHPTAQRPFVQVRADNMFIHVYPLQLNDLNFWKAYIDMLARNRYNLLDLHGAYDLQTTSFPNLYPMLVHVPEYPNVGNAAEQARALGSFRAIIAYAHSRGLKVAFMNYSANDGKGGAEKNAPSVTGVPAALLADYTAKAVTLLIHELPDLDELGFRVGESGQDASFYQNAYIRGVKDAGRADLRLYTRSWQTTKKQLLPIAAAARNGFDIEIKYNGEQLGLPYQAMQGARFGSYSYEDYLDLPADYRIIWQVRANGTHRFWTWENTAFIRRTVQTFSLGAAGGFTLEPLIAYFSTDPRDYYRSSADQAVYGYIWEKEWMWYYAWGRLGYDPNLPEYTLVKAFERHYGSAGAQIYSALQHASEILPLAYSYRFVGPDQRDFSPETESGNVPGKRGSNPFIDNHPMDERSFVGTGGFVDDRLAGRPDGRVGPFEVASRLRESAGATRVGSGAVGNLSGKAADEWRLLRADLLSAASLGDYYADRIEGMTYAGYAIKTGREAEHRLGLAKLTASRADWAKLSDIADAVYRPLSNPLRRQLNFQWAGQLPSIDAADAAVEKAWASHKDIPGSPALTASASDLGQSGLAVSALSATVSAAKDRAFLRCEVSFSGSVSKVILWHKALPSQLAWEETDLQAGPGGGYSTSLPLGPEGLMYLVEVQDRVGNAAQFPNLWDHTPYQILPAFAPLSSP